MLRAPYMRVAAAGHEGTLLPLEYHGGSSHGAASALEQLCHLDDGGRFATANVAPSLTLWLYRSSLLRRLWLEGVVFDAIVEDRLTARGFTALLRRTFQTPRFLRGEETSTQEEAIGLVWGVQREFALHVVAAIVDENQWHWTLREA
ncbi:hypothetical protein TraAM80_06378 [Trypanosoma rangeli]|uniref:Uncharacterized protein n=1 Tax=Trypanosoma rangeli TaxID=5698 RepID=A0A3R7RGY1_TRYRA|nr:uncharacterized protein TraAM80_06378 [Trypanosoma rangeli]RNF02482.1 hypothetical protein TraAM80_06378 [Trypanosoma rangeli]|eukprot:RNF02482.1 hypothetical protein TraAM80_06378 [Trypanosoma rangeli]